MQEDESSKVASLGGRLEEKSRKAREGNGVSSVERNLQDQLLVSMSHSCKHCQQVFRSRQALYGHMRIHSVGERSVAKKVRAFRLVFDGQRAVCDICRKEFQSMKSLYGHMRTHPEREWRGMRPPASSAAKPKFSCSSTVVSDQIDGSDTTIMGPALEPAVVDLSKSLSGWPMTGKRGRGAAITSSSGLGQQDLGSKFISSSLSKAKIEPFSQLNLSGTCFARGRMMEPYAALDKGNADQTSGKEFKSYQEDKGKKMRKKRRLNELDAAENHDKQVDGDPAGTRKSYRCSVCNRSFSSYQALGGHKTSHSKVKSIPSQSVQPQDRRPNANPSSQHDTDHIDSSKWHKCEICKRKFQIGQGMGGHDRFHWTGPAPVSRVPMTSPLEASKMQQRKPLNIDLNELPPAEEEEEVLLGEDLSIHSSV